MNKSSENIISDQRIKLSFWQSIGHYSFMLVPLMIPAFELFYNLSGKNTINTFSNTAIFIFIATSIFVGYLKWRELTYYQIEGERTDEEFENAVLASANKLKWNIINFKANIVEAIGKGSDPHKITIKREVNKVLVNSMIEPEFMSAPDFFCINKKNRSTFMHYYSISNNIQNLNEKVVQQIKGERIENELEWNLKNTLKRLIAYLFSFGFIGIAIAIWQSEGFNISILIFGFIGSFYIVLDIYIMWKKRIKPAHNKR